MQYGLQLLFSHAQVGWVLGTVCICEGCDGDALALKVFSCCSVRRAGRDNCRILCLHGTVTCLLQHSMNLSYCSLPTSKHSQRHWGLI